MNGEKISTPDTSSTSRLLGKGRLEIVYYPEKVMNQR